MLDEDGLNVWNDQRLVGYLWRNPQGLIGFRYEEEWLSNSGFAISQTIPLRQSEFLPQDLCAHRFFANLLPEAKARDHIVRDLKIPDTDFDLLRAIGGECAGALSILQAEYQPALDYKYHKVSEKELINLVKRRGQVTTWGTNDRPRLLLAGAQDKCPLLLRDASFWLPQKESPSSHILKFEVSEYRHLPAYETFTTMMASAIGLPSVEVQLNSIADTRYALIERYDRFKLDSGKLTRLHQEDFCQALGFGHQYKYQEHGGPSFADCYRLVRDVSSDPANDLIQLLRWQIFNVLAGNSDGHAKNLSFLYLPNGDTRLAPFYDLVCTRAIERIDYHLAFSVGEQRNPNLISSKDWDDMARQCEISPKFIQGLVQDMVGKLNAQLQPVRAKFQQLYGEYKALQRIEKVVVSQCQRAAS